MDPEVKRLLEENLALSKENNSMLHALRRSQKWAAVMRWLYWIFIIGSFVGAYVFLEPYLTSLTSVYTNNKGVLDSLKSFGTQAQNGQLQDLLKSIQ